MSWLSITIETDCQHAETLADALMEAGAISASIEDADAGTPSETPQFGEPGSITTPGWERSKVIALLESGTDAQALVASCSSIAGLNAIPKKSYFSEYPSRIDHRMTTAFLARWHAQVHGTDLFPGNSFNLDFHSVPHYGEDPIIERHYVSARSRRQPSVLVFLAQDAQSRVFCYSNADLRKGEEAQEIFQFIAFWKRTHDQTPSHLVFDSRLTTFASLARLDQMNIPFITLRRRSLTLLKEIVLLPRSAWRTVELDVPSRKFRTPRVFEQTVALAGRQFRQLFIQDLGHEEPTILLTNQREATHKTLITRYAQRMLIENALSVWAAGQDRSE